MRSCECPKCGEDISESYVEYDPDVGILSAGWYCDKCDKAVLDEGDDQPEDYLDAPHRR